MLSGILASLSVFHFVIVPFLNIRQTPSESSEIISQAYFSEEVNIIDKKDDWIKIETAVDHYQGWTRSLGICHRDEHFSQNASKKTVKVNRCMAHVYDVPDIIYGPILSLPFESLLEVEEDINERWIKVILPDYRKAFIQRGDILFESNHLSQSDLPFFSLRFLGLPYTWGGRSSFGYDCSGFVQMLYRQMGVYLPRDSKDQAEWEGFKSIAIDKLSPGDLIFFAKEKHKVQHVGMYLGNDKFIHTTVTDKEPYIHISDLSDPDWNGETKYRTARTLKS